MPIMDVFRGDAFSAVSLTAAVDKMGYVPGYLGSIPNLVTPVPIRTTNVWIEDRSNAPALIQTSPRGTAPSQKGGDRRTAREFRTVRIANASRIYAEELQNVREFGSEANLKQLTSEIARRQFKMKADFDLTHENMRFGMVQGLVVDADGSVINDWFAEFGQSAIPEVGFDLLNNASDGEILRKCNEVRRQMGRNLQGVGGANVQVHSICNDEFWDDLITAQEVRETYKFAMEATKLQNDVGGIWESFKYGNIMWHNYRGTDDNTTLAVQAGKCKFFPVGSGIFQKAQAPAEKFEFVNTLGQAEYSWIVPDRDRDLWADVEMYAYPLYVCTMPQALASGRAGA